MDKRTKILAGAFGAVMLYAFVSAVAYPKWIVPLLTLDDRIAVVQKDLDRLEDGERETEEAKRKYRAYLDRVGSFDPVVVENDLRERLNHLIAKHSLVDQTVSPRRPSTDRKSGIQKMIIAITASGTLESAVGFLKEVAELPHLFRIGNAAIYPASASRREQVGPERVNIRVPLEVWILPSQRILGGRLTEEDLNPPDAVVRHDADADYALIWEREPFTPYVPPKPLVASAGRNLTVNVDGQALLQGKATGGVGDYTYRWEPAEGLTDATSPRPKLTDTSKIGEYEYTLTVSDEGGNTSTGTVTVTICEPDKIAEVETDEPSITEPAKPSGPQRWKNGKNLRLTMALIRKSGGQRESEFMVSDGATEEASYYAPGDEFDGGELVYVHPRGAIVRRQDDYFVYPIGAALNEDLLADAAVEFPELQRIASAISAAQTEPEEFIEPVSNNEVIPASTPDRTGGEEMPPTAIPEAGLADPTQQGAPPTGKEPPAQVDQTVESESATAGQPADEGKDAPIVDDAAEAPEQAEREQPRATPAGGTPKKATGPRDRPVVKQKRGAKQGENRTRPKPATTRTKKKLPVKKP